MLFVSIFSPDRGGHGPAQCQDDTHDRMVQEPILTFAVYTHSRGNYYFHEIRDLMVAGLEELGQRTILADENGWVAEAEWHLINAPHEFFVLERPWSVTQSLPKNLIMLSTEQPTTPWFKEAVRQFSQARMIWDINPHTSEILRKMGYPCQYLGLGYVPGFPLAEPVDRLPETTSTCFLESRIQDRSWLNGRWLERPIDILFIGGLTPRRESFFAEAAQSMAKHCQYIRLLSTAAPLRPSLNVNLNTEVVIGLAQRSKILLNIHRGTDNYFEWHRMVLQGMWQKAMVLSEPCAPLPPFQPNRDFVEVPIEGMPACIDHYLADPVGREEAEKIALQGYKTLTERARFSESLKKCLRGLRSC